MLADWAEMSLLFGDLQSISKSEFSVALEEDMKPNADDIVTTIWQEIFWRKSVSPKSYPIDVFEGYIERRTGWKRAICYSFLTLLSAQSFIPEIKIRPGQWTSTSKMFEKVTELALQTYVGETIVTGSPRQEGVPASFDACLGYLCGKLGEDKRAKPCSTEHTKDDGLDVIAWKPLDGRSGKLIVLTQCAAGADWRNKTKELSTNVWDEYVEWPLTPLRAFAFPYINNKDWRRLSLEGGLLLDRLRLSLLCERRLRGRFRHELERWIEGKIDSLPVTD